MNDKIFASKIGGQFASELGGQFNRYLHMKDKYGFLSDQPMDSNEMITFKITEEEFNKIWTTTQRHI